MEAIPPLPSLISKDDHVGFVVSSQKNRTPQIKARIATIVPTHFHEIEKLREEDR